MHKNKNNEEQRMQVLKSTLSGRHALDIFQSSPYASEPVFMDLESSVYKNMSAEEIIGKIQSGDISIYAMDANKYIPGVEDVKMSIGEEYADDSIRMIRVDVSYANEHGNRVSEEWTLSDLDFSAEYRAHWDTLVDDRKFKLNLENSFYENRVAHCAIMDLLDRTIRPDSITENALSALHLTPKHSNNDELVLIVNEMKDNMLKYCDEHHVAIDAMNTLHPDEIIGIRDAGRDVLRSHGLDMELNERVDEYRDSIAYERDDCQVRTQAD